METSIIEWQAFEHHHEEKNSDWFWAVGIVAVSLTATAIILHNVVFGIFILVATTTLAIHAARAPRLLNMRIDDLGITLGDVLYPYSALESFWVNKFEHTLLIDSKRFFMPLIVIELGTADATEIRNTIIQHLAEKEHHEPLLQKLMEYLGF